MSNKTVSLESLSTPALLALKKAFINEISNREETSVGTHSVDEQVTLSVAASVSKFASEEYIPTIKIAHKAALALVLRYAGITGQHAVSALQKAMVASLEVDQKSEEFIKAMADLDLAETKVSDMLGKLPKAVRKGKTTVKLQKVEGK